uniref:DUF4780 domain-containing protein n=1 Tax=Cacopsylla melanoneura TaxID=428564 RepID=A0A8D8UEP1_9HEMI
MADFTNTINEETAPQSAADLGTNQDLDKELQDLEKDLTKSSDSEMDIDGAQNNEHLTEAVNKLQIKEKRMNGAARKRFKWLIKQGLPAAEARAKAMEKLPESARTSKKRGRSEESTPESKGEKFSEQKKPKVQLASQITPDKGSEAVPGTSTAMNFANALKTIKVGVFLENYPEENLTNTQMGQIQEDLIMKVIEKETSPSPQFSGYAYRPGWLSISCDNEATAEWLKNVVGSVKPWEGAKLKAVDEADLPKSKVLSCYFPNSSHDDTEKILKLIKAQNGLASSEWKILRRTNEGTAAHLIMSVDLASIEQLKKQDYKISFKFSKVILHNKSEQKARDPKPAKEKLVPSGGKSKPPATQSQKPEKAETNPSTSQTTEAKEQTSGAGTVSTPQNVKNRRTQQGRQKQFSDSPLKGLRPSKGKKDWKPHRSQK